MIINKLDSYRNIKRYLINFCKLPERATRSEGRSRPTFLNLSLSSGSVANGEGRLTLDRLKNACKLSLLPKGTLQEGPPAFIFRITIVFRELFFFFCKCYRD